MKAFMVCIMLAWWAVLGMACLVDTEIEEAKAARTLAPADTCAPMPQCVDPRPPGTR